MKTHETDFPAHKTAPKKKIRLPRPYENNIGTKGDQPPPTGRTEGPFQIKSLKRAEFKRLSREGKRIVGKRICIDWIQSQNGPRLGITASKRYGNAPERNRFKRLVREAFRQNYSRLPNIDLNVVPRQQAKGAKLQEIASELCAHLCC